MGLDMYLYRKTYVKNWDHMGPESLHQINVKLNNKKHPYIKKDLICSISEDVGYWRKFNALHQWFVNNCQNGVDDCKEYYVGDEQLEELFDICKRIKKDNSLADELLPAQGGFFFGTTEYDNWYFSDIDNTIKILKPLIALNKKIDKKQENNERVYDLPGYYYQSSW